jgi:dienelactone hydrolase
MKKELKFNRQNIFQVIFIIIAVVLFNTIGIIPNSLNESPYYLNKSIKNLPPVQIHNGNKDSIAAVTESEEFYKLLQTNGKIAEIYIYDGLQHAFNYPSYTLWFNAEAANLSLERTIKFLDKYLKN